MHLLNFLNSSEGYVRIYIAVPGTSGDATHTAPLNTQRTAAVAYHLQKHFLDFGTPLFATVTDFTTETIKELSLPWSELILVSSPQIFQKHKTHLKIVGAVTVK
jgi:hypothetical protein